MRDCRYVKYKPTLDNTTRYNERQPMLILYFYNIWACITSENDWYLQININGSAKIKMGLHYWNMGIDVSSGTPTLRKNFNEHHCLLVPELIKVGLSLPEADPIFAIIASQWLDVNPDLVTGKPIFKKPKVDY